MVEFKLPRSISTPAELLKVSTQDEKSTLLPTNGEEVHKEILYNLNL